MYKYDYALEKFSRAIFTLSTGEDDIRKRLLCIFTGDLATISIDHIPEKLHSEFEFIIKEMTKYDEKREGENDIYKSEDGRYNHLLPTKIEATCSRIQKKTGSKIAQKIYHIWSVLNEASYEQSST